MKRFALLAAVFALITPSSRAVSLYTGSTAGGPESQGSLSYFSSAFTAAPVSSAGHVTLTSTAAEMVGYSNYTILSSLVNPAFPTLDPTAPTGYTLSFDLKLDAESHTGTDRGGFSVILEGNDKKGIQLDFWNNQIFAQNTTPLFTHGEQTTSFDPTTPLTPGGLFNHYDLNITGSTYTLKADGNTILTSTVRDYNSAAPNTLAYTAYHLPNYVFFGDDTSEANSSTEIYNISVAVPEPASMLLLGTISIGWLLRRRRA